MKLRNASDLQEHLDHDFAWRIREIDNAKNIARQAPPKRRQAAVRSGLPLLYAHWEGFVKNAAEAFLNYVLYQRHSYEQLKPCFIAHGLASQLDLLVESGKHTRRAGAVEFILYQSSNRASFSWKKTISTRSNLNSATFEDIAAALAIGTAEYQPRYKFIDESLLSRRNKIAHGEWLDLDVKGLRDVADEVIVLPSVALKAANLAPNSLS